MSQATKKLSALNVQGWRVAGLCVVLAAITFVVFGQTVGFKFINFDDDLYVYENARVAGGLSLKGLAWVFTHADCNFYHPLTMLSLMVDNQLHGLHAGGYHFSNVLLHTASVVLLFLVLRQMTGALWRSAFVAAVFAIHPLRVESVAWVAERKDVLGAFFFMLTLGAYVHYVRKPKSLLRYLLVAVAFVLALLSKPTMMTLPFVLLLLDYWPLRRVESTGRLVLEKIPLLALAVGAGVMTVLAEGKAVAPLGNISMSLRLGNALVSYAVYLRQMIWPEGLAVFYPYPRHGLPAWEVTLAGLLLAGLCAVAAWQWRKRRWLLVGWLWYLGMLAPMIGLVQVGEFARADRMTYLPQIGIYVAVTWWVAEWRLSRIVFGGLMAGVVAVLMVCAWKQTGYWKDSETLWTRALSCTTDNYAAHINRGNVLRQKGKVSEAIAQYQEALQINPNYAETHNDLGIALFQEGRAEEAISHFQTALQIKPDDAEIHNNLGTVLRQTGRVDEAIAQDQKALLVKPDYADAHNNLGLALFQKGSMDEAIIQYQEALQINPAFAEAHNDLGIALFQKGRAGEAISHFQAALQIKPDYAEVHNNLGTALRQMGKVDEAIIHFQKALQLEPDNPQVQNALAWLLATCAEASLRNGEKAVQLAQKANALTGGENPAILHTLAAALAETGRFGDAVQSAQKAIVLARAAGRQDLAAQLNDEMKRYEAGLPLHQ